MHDVARMETRANFTYDDRLHGGDSSNKISPVSFPLSLSLSLSRPPHVICVIYVFCIPTGDGECLDANLALVPFLLVNPLPLL